MLRSGQVVSGGSTLTMQVARILETDPEASTRTPWGKARQILRALQLEAHLSKREILTLYPERAPFGGTIEAIGRAAGRERGGKKRYSSVVAESLKTKKR